MLTSRTLNTGATSIDRILGLTRAVDQAFATTHGSRGWVPPMDVAERGDASRSRSPKPRRPSRDASSSRSEHA